MSTLAKKVRAELQATGQPPTLRVSILRRPFGPSREQRRALMAGRSAVFSAEWLASQFKPGTHPSLPPSFAAAPFWRLEADGDALSPVTP